jgi:hypothetical protein
VPQGALFAPKQARLAAAQVFFDRSHPRPEEILSVIGSQPPKGAGWSLGASADCVAEP